MKYLSMVAIMAFLITSCDKGNVKKKLEFDKIITLKSEPFELFKQPCVSSINLIDRYIFLIDQCEEKFVHLYNAENYEYYGSFGGKGEGPKEFIFPEIYNQGYVDEADSLHVLIYDDIKKRLADVNVNNIMYGSRQDFKLYHPSHDGAYVSNFLSLKNFLFTGIFAEYPNRFFINDLKTGDLKSFKYLPENNITVPKGEEFVIFRNIIRTKPDGSAFVSALDLFPQIDIFDLDGNKTATYALAGKNERLNLNTSIKPLPHKAMHYYMGLFVSNRYIYALNWNMSQQEFIDNVNVPGQIHVFDWKGNPIIQYQLDQKIAAIIVDEKKNIIIGINDTKEHPFFVYKLGDELNF